jgi:hypothetical protein
MIKQFSIAIFLIVLFVQGIADNNSDGICNEYIPNSAIRNSIKFNCDILESDHDVLGCDFSDDFNLPVLRSHWNVVIESGRWSLKERPGYLRIKAQKNQSLKNISTENTFYHYIDPNTRGQVESLFDLATMGANTFAGLYFKCEKVHFIGINNVNGEKNLLVSVSDKEYIGPVITQNKILIRVRIQLLKAWFEYSLNGTEYFKIGDEFNLVVDNYANNLIGYYCQSTANEDSSVDIDWFYFNPQLDNSVYFTENSNKILIPEI